MVRSGNRNEEPRRARWWCGGDADEEEEIGSHASE